MSHVGQSKHFLQLDFYGINMGLTTLLPHLARWNAWFYFLSEWSMHEGAQQLDLRVATHWTNEMSTHESKC